MLKLLKLFLILLILLTLPTLGILSIKKFFPDDFKTIEDKGKIILVNKIPFVERFLNTPKPLKTHKQVLEDQKATMEETVVDYFTNQDVYKTICESEGHYNPKDKFIGCNQCPKYLSTNNPDYFNSHFYAVGSVIKKDESESVFFMSGCAQGENTIAIVLRKGFGGWQRVSQFKKVSFDEPPLIFKDAQGFLVFVGKRKVNTGTAAKETLFSLSFKHNKLHIKDIFALRSSSSLKCSYQFLAVMDKLSLVTEHKFSVNLDVMGWQDVVNSDCKIPTRNRQVRLKPGAYTLNFTQKDNTFMGDKLTQKIITELEKAQE